jgi:hypothetical protein
VNEYRDFIIRDAGYWALSLYSIYHFLAYTKSKNIGHLIWWQILLLLGTMFRIEGILLLALMPFVLLVDSQNSSRIRAFITSYTWMLAIVVLGSIFYLINPSSSEAFSKLSELNWYTNWEKHAVFITHGENIIDQQIINPRATSEGYGLIVLLVGFLGVTLTQILHAYSLSATLLTFMSVKKINKTLSQQDSLVWLFVIVTQIAMLYGFFLTTQLLTTRYCIFTALMLLVWFMPAITEFIHQSILAKKKVTLFFLCLILFYSAVDAFHHSGSKAYFINDSLEAAVNLNAESEILTNNPLLGFYLKQANPELNTSYRKNVKGMNRFDYVYIEPHRLSKNQLSKLSTEWVLINSYGTEKRPILLYKNPQSK